MGIAESSDVSVLEVIYEDNHILAVYKPHGVLVQGDRTQDLSLLELTKAWLKKEKGKPGNVFLGLVHRLDRPAAGIVLFGRTSKGASRLSEQFRDHSVTKTYQVLVEGVVKADRGELVHSLESDETHSWVSTAPAAKRAELSYEVLTRASDKTLLMINLVTGRKHQIRVQCASMGHPVVGDGKYGAKSVFQKGGAIGLVAHAIEFDRATEPKERVKLVLSPELFTLGISK